MNPKCVRKLIWKLDITVLDLDEAILLSLDIVGCMSCNRICCQQCLIETGNIVSVVLNWRVILACVPGVVMIHWLLSTVIKIYRLMILAHHRLHELISLDRDVVLDILVIREVGNIMMDLVMVLVYIKLVAVVADLRLCVHYWLHLYLLGDRVLLGLTHRCQQLLSSLV